MEGMLIDSTTLWFSWHASVVGSRPFAASDHDTLRVPTLRRTHAARFTWRRACTIHQPPLLTGGEIP